LEQGAEVERIPLGQALYIAAEAVETALQQTSLMRMILLIPLVRQAQHMVATLRLLGRGTV
jgi:hypothetical protein